MAARKRHKSKKSPVLHYRQLTTETLYQRIEESRQAGKLTAAIDMAKECRRRASSPAHAELLGGLYIARGRQLIDKRLYAEALMVLNNALSLGQGSAELLRMVFECGLHARQYSSAVSALSRLEDPSDRQRASSVLVDEALAAGDALERQCEPAIREGVQRIRRAFAALERGDHPTATDELKPIGLSHPCAGWKWLLLGLSAYLRGDPARARTCWERIQDGTRAGRLGELLCSALIPNGSQRAAGDRELRAKVVRHFENSRVGVLEQIQEALAEERPGRALNLCKELLTTIDVQDRASYGRRLGRAICTFIVEERETARRFGSVFGALPEDPELIRTAAIAAEKEGSSEAVEIWKYYLDELDHVEGIPREQREQARAMIWQRMGDLARKDEEAEGPYNFAPDFYGRPSADAAYYYRQSLKYDPADLRTHEKLLDYLSTCDEPKQAERAATAILKRWPGHVSSLLWLGTAALERKAFRKAFKFFERAREAEPFNDRIRDKIQYCYMRSARRRMEQGKDDLARRDYDEAEKLGDGGEGSRSVYCKRAALEWRVGDAQRAEAFLARALASEAAPVAAYFQLVIELERAEAPLEVRRRFEAILAGEWKRPPTADAAWKMIALMEAIDAENVWYPSRAEHEDALIGYLEHAVKVVAFSEEQLLAICAFLERVEGWDALEQAGWSGVNRYAKNYRFALFLGRAHAGRGARRMPRKVRRVLRDAGELATEARDLEAVTELALLVSGAPRGLGLEGLLGLLGASAVPEELLEEFADLDLPPDLPEPRRRQRKRGKRSRDRGQMPLFEGLY